jgi:transposase-like protein
LPDSLNDLSEKIKALEQENDILRKALAELADEKMTMAYNFLGSSLRIRMLLQQPLPSSQQPSQEQEQ